MKISKIEETIKRYEANLRNIKKGGGIYVIVRHYKKEGNIVIAWVSIVDTKNKIRETFKKRRYELSFLKSIMKKEKI